MANCTKTYEDTLHAQIVHAFRYVNKDLRAGLTRCGMYVEFRPTSLHEGVPTCVPCVSYVAPSCLCDALSQRMLPDAARLAGHHPGCYVVAGFDAVDERIEDVVRECVKHGVHNVACDDDGHCMMCGYQFDTTDWNIDSWQSNETT